MRGAPSPRRRRTTTERVGAPNAGGDACVPVPGCGAARPVLHTVHREIGSRTGFETLALVIGDRVGRQRRGKDEAVALTHSRWSSDGGDGIRVEVLSACEIELILQRIDFGRQVPGKGFVFRLENKLDVFFDRDQQIFELRMIARLHFLRRGHPVFVEKCAVDWIEINDCLASVGSPPEFGMVSRETISLDTQIVVLQAPNGAGAFAEKQSFGFTTFLRFHNEFQVHAQWIRCFRVGISVVLNYRKIQFQSAMFSRSSRGIGEDCVPECSSQHVARADRFER